MCSKGSFLGSDLPNAVGAKWSEMGAGEGEGDKQLQLGQVNVAIPEGN